MCLHENIRNQSSHRDFQSVNLKCQLKEIQNFTKGTNLETLLKKYSYCPLYSTFSNPHYTSDWLVASILDNVGISKTVSPQIKALIELEKNPKYLKYHAHAAYHHSPKFKVILLILCLIHAWFVLGSSQYYSYTGFPPNVESVSC